MTLPFHPPRIIKDDTKQNVTVHGWVEGRLTARALWMVDVRFSHQAPSARMLDEERQVTVVKAEQQRKRKEFHEKILPEMHRK
jgi:hypothetical protein